MDNNLVELRSELLLIKSMLDGYRLYKKAPKYLTDAIDLYGEVYGDTSLQETVDRINRMIRTSFN